MTYMAMRLRKFYIETDEAAYEVEGHGVYADGNGRYVAVVEYDQNGNKTVTAAFFNVRMAQDLNANLTLVETEAPEG